MPTTYRYTMSRRNALLAGIIGSLLLLGSVLAIVLGWSISVAGGSLPPDLARYLFGLIAVLGIAVLGLGLRLRTIGERTIMLDQHGIRVPRSELSKAMIRIDYGAIQSVDVEQYNDIQTLVIRHRGGMVKLRSPHFASRETFAVFHDDLLAALDTSAGEARRH